MIAQIRRGFVIASLMLLAACSVGGLSFDVDVYTPERDRAFILNIFDKNWDWLISEDSFDFSVEHMLDTRSSSKRPENYGNMTIKVGLEDGKPVGFSSYYLKSADKAQLLFLAMDEQYRGKGYAQKLLQHMLDELALNGITTVELITRVRNVRAQHIYKKIGFKEMWRDEEFIIYRRSL